MSEAAILQDPPLPSVPASVQEPGQVTEAFPRVTFPKGEADPFRKALEARVDAYFAETGFSRKGGWYSITKTAVIFTWLIASYLGLLFLASTWWQAGLLSLSLAFAFAAVGFNVLHDGGHGAFSEKPWLNRLAAWSFDFIGGSSYIWSVKHNVVHHTFTNVMGADDDLELTPFFRLAPTQPLRAYHRYQWLYWPLLYPWMAVKWHLWEDFRMLQLGKISRYTFAPPRGWDRAVLLGGKVFSFITAFVIPFALHPWWAVLACYAVITGTVSMILAIVFQMAHAVEEAEAIPPPSSGKVERAWFEHQLATTVNFAPHDPILSWYVGGLNFQVEHHLFPKISHRHYPALRKLVKQTCDEFGLRYRENPTFWAALCSHVRFLRRAGRNEFAFANGADYKGVHIPVATG